MDRGIILIASGHPYYTHMAYNLAMSIRFHSEIPIILFHDTIGIKYLFKDQQEVFTDMVELPHEFYYVDGKAQYVKSKLHIYDLSPFEETVFLDADMIFSPYKKVEDLFDENRDKLIQFACRGERSMADKTKSEWVTLSEIQAVHGFTHWYELSSEVIYFKKCEQVQEFFDIANYYYHSHGMEVKRWVNNVLEKKVNAIQEFAGGIPDEVPFSLAFEKSGMKITAPYRPSYWQPEFVNKTIPDVDIQKKHYLISAGGATMQPNIKRIYDNLAKHYARHTVHKRPPYQLRAKRDLIKERSKI